MKAGPRDAEVDFEFTHPTEEYVNFIPRSQSVHKQMHFLADPDNDMMLILMEHRQNKCVKPGLPCRLKQDSARINKRTFCAETNAILDIEISDEDPIILPL